MKVKAVLALTLSLAALAGMRAICSRFNKAAS